MSRILIILCLIFVLSSVHKMYKKISANCNFESMKIDISMEPEFDLRISTSSVLSNRAKNLTPEHWNNLR